MKEELKRNGRTYESSNRGNYVEGTDIPKLIEHALKLTKNKTELAHKLGTRVQTITAWQRGSWPTKESLLAIYRFLEKK